MKKYILLLLLFAAGFGNAQNSEKIRSVKDFQKQMNRDFKDPETSPLPPKERKKFTALDFFSIDTAFTVVAEFVRTPYESPFEMPTTTDRKPVYVKYGELFFSLKGKEFKLNVYQNQDPKKGYEDYLFLPFTDLTNGETTYSGGRYLDMMLPKSSEVLLDFNKAYNPYCAYSGDYSCPLVPQENHLAVEIPAGVKAYQK
ncbi:hypothetical protein SAMN04488034_10495 [Salinimicrobium catena]|uniref:DUF1684 domain-containing protein n=1 Tax=Salinimicrobium catena TaxID=390640 RepID=A0A1H5NDI3_9FLAO|nr:DUF1684 domain-containing protein [Salinimicrobium catena]SDL43723.1 hypothetical protein SAMN04488140_10495 [Salinimicrobium catena]SEE99663.1 hypothetical protein SAMN04488034_10495 [Salinimicrobium catena]